MYCINCGQSVSTGLEKCPQCNLPFPTTEPTELRREEAATLISTEEKTRLASPQISLGNRSEEFSSNPTLMAAPTVKPLEAGQVLGNRYEIKGCIGSGGMGAIYTARRIHIGDTVAVKVLRPEVVQDAQSRERFQREARAAARLHHPNAVVVHDFGQDPDGTTYIVMEYLEGQSLRDVMSEEKMMALPRAASLLKQACAAIEAAHRLGIIHRDIKPDNIILLDSHDDVPHVKILDFGIAKLLDHANETGEADPTLTQVGTVIGTPNYMSPEQCQGEPLDARSDVYSLGVVLYEMLTGVQPFTAKNSTGIVIKHVTEKPRRLMALNPELPSEVERVVLKALEKKPEARQQSAWDLAREFELAVQQSSSANPLLSVAPTLPETKVETRITSPIAKVEKAELIEAKAAKAGRLPLYAVAGAALVLLAGSLTAWLLFATPSAPQPQPSAKDVLAQLPPQKVEPQPVPTAPPMAAPQGMVLINGGEFKMGRDGGNDIDQPAHPVTVKPFFIDQTEVTNAAYQKFLAATQHLAPPSWHEGRFAAGLENYPVTDVTWEDAQAFAKWAGKRLPTEAEWEYAARGNDGRLYPWGDTYKPGVANINDDTGVDAQEVKTKPVGIYNAGKTIFGLFDMAGNVWEWTADDLQAYPGGKLPPEAETYQNLKVIRGGAWKSEPKQATTTYRRGWPATRNDWPLGIAPSQIDYSAIGFRCAQDVPQP